MAQFIFSFDHGHDDGDFVCPNEGNDDKAPWDTIIPCMECPNRHSCADMAAIEGWDRWSTGNLPYHRHIHLFWEEIRQLHVSGHHIVLLAQRVTAEQAERLFGM